MLWELLTSRRIIAGIVFCIVIVSGSLLYSWHFQRTTARELAPHDRFLRGPQKQSETRPTEAVNVQNANETAEIIESPTKSIVTGMRTPEEAAALSIETGENAIVRTVQMSSNPLFADGVPEHLQPSEEWIGTYMSEASPEALASLRAIAFEVIEKYNPNRPIADIWDTFIAAEKAYIANADPSKGTVGVGAGRYDWLIQESLDFPEIIQIYNEDMSRFYDMRLVELGIMVPDWNVQILPDGREFRPADDYYYTVISRSGTEDNYKESRISFGFSGTGATPVTIDLANTSDAELERLGGWNYNINPYTSGLYQVGGNQ